MPILLPFLFSGNDQSHALRTVLHLQKNPLVPITQGDLTVLCSAILFFLSIYFQYFYSVHSGSLPSAVSNFWGLLQSYYHSGWSFSSVSPHSWITRKQLSPNSIKLIWIFVRIAKIYLFLMLVAAAKNRCRHKSDIKYRTCSSFHFFFFFSCSAHLPEAWQSITTSLGWLSWDSNPGQVLRPPPSLRDPLVKGGCDWTEVSW